MDWAKKLRSAHDRTELENKSYEKEINMLYFSGTINIHTLVSE